MTKRRPKDIGTDTETGALNYLNTRFNLVRREVLHGEGDRGDLHLIWEHHTAVVFQVKGGHAAEQASDAQIEAWVKEADEQSIRAAADYGILITKRKGKGKANAHLWWASFVAELASGQPNWCSSDALVRMTLEEACNVLEGWGYR
jgi:hypothetical protein